MKSLFLLPFLVITYTGTRAQKETADTLFHFSNSLQKNTRSVVIKPVDYNPKQQYPVLYLLHGYSGKYNNWIIKVPIIKKYADDFKMIIVCPDGENSWYVNEPGHQHNQYEKYISSELIELIDDKYATYRDRNKRAITGLSMGGHGALTLAVKRPEIFGAAGSMSGAVDLISLKSKYNLIAIAGDTTLTHFNWKDHSALELLDSTTAGKLHLIIDCGVEDIFIEYNRSLHKKLTTQKVNHDYIERAGGHNWYYWENALPYQLLFFKRYFEK